METLTFQKWSIFHRHIVILLNTLLRWNQHDFPTPTQETFSLTWKEMLNNKPLDTILLLQYINEVRSQIVALNTSEGISKSITYKVLNEIGRKKRNDTRKTKTPIKLRKRNVTQTPKVSFPFSKSLFLPVEFKLEEVKDCNRFILAGLYPPTHSKQIDQYSNRTSKDISILLGHREFDWIDLFPFAPEKSNKDIYCDELDFFLQDNPTFVQTWIERILQRCQSLTEKGHLPIVYICGKICKYHWFQYPWKTHGFQLTQQAHIFDIMEYKRSDFTFIVVINHHPSAHLHRSSSKNQVVFERCMKLISLLSKEGLSTIQQVMTYEEQRSIHILNECMLTKLEPTVSISHLYSKLQLYLEDTSYLESLCNLFHHYQSYKPMNLLHRKDFLLRWKDPCYRQWIVFLSTQLDWYQWYPFVVSFVPPYASVKKTQDASQWISIWNIFRQQYKLDWIVNMFQNSGIYFGLTNPIYQSQLCSCLQNDHVRPILCRSFVFAKLMYQKPMFFSNALATYRINPDYFTSLYQNSDYLEKLYNTTLDWEENQLYWKPFFSSLDSLLCYSSFTKDMMNPTYRSYVTITWYYKLQSLQTEGSVLDLLLKLCSFPAFFRNKYFIEEFDRLYECLQSYPLLFAPSRTKLETCVLLSGVPRLLKYPSSVLECYNMVYEILQQDAFLLFRNSSFVKRIVHPSYLDNMKRWSSLLHRQKLLFLFGSKIFNDHVFPVTWHRKKQSISVIANLDAILHSIQTIPILSEQILHDMITKKK